MMHKFLLLILIFSLQNFII